MTPIKGHFDGTSIVLDEPASLPVGQIVHVFLTSESGPQTLPRRSRFGFAKGTFEMSDDFNEPLEDFAEYR